MNGVLQYVYEGGIKDGLEQSKTNLLVSQFNDKKILVKKALIIWELVRMSF